MNYCARSGFDNQFSFDISVTRKENYYYNEETSEHFILFSQFLCSLSERPFISIKGKMISWHLIPICF